MEKKRIIKNVVHIGDVLQHVIKQYRYVDDTEISQVFRHWKSMVGKDIADITKPKSLDNHILTVLVNNSSDLYHLRFLKSDIIAKLNASLPNNIIKDIKFKIA
ncbi:MAG: DUF721 domain-containing protein [Desulfobacterales bacterium]|nr:DUF721 domain-containing protein [Desulfobacterales bacterium]